MRLRLPWKGKSGGTTESKEVPWGMREATAAEASAKKHAEEARGRSGEVSRVVRRLREFQQVNHIGERVAQALQDGYGKQEGDHGH